MPTFAEAGFAGYDVPLRWGMAAPGHACPIIDKLNAALSCALATDEVRQRLAIRRRAAADHARRVWRDHRPRGDDVVEMVKAAGIKPE